MIGSAISLWGFGMVVKLRNRFGKGEIYVREYNTQIERENGVANEL